MENRRQFTRILFSIKAELEIKKSIYHVSIHDISLNGALVTAIESEQSLTGKQGTLHFLLSDDESEVNMNITVVHEEANETGLQCNAIDIDSATHLRRLVELNLGNNEQLNKELSQLTRMNNN
ncbi:PilZ domain-containing protein [Colwellia psychrerythraea]|uniref:Cyclic diguanosine monophosphate-binding protein n=1 Tax=Colwellia psychrerythraea TaxID=28229 RepID=A0A099KRW6_COLPS|nr:PilZ domain-containing protein [Colwellia psychrerythraea]KGJ93261.1 type IV pilus assembly PilZ [Colwellia psychrerythraea]